MTKRASLLVLLCCIVWLHGCRTIPIATTLPSVCPAPREKPQALMRELPQLLPALADYLPKFQGPEGTAEALRQVRIDSAGQYQACLVGRQALIDWINAQP